MIRVATHVRCVFKGCDVKDTLMPYAPCQDPNFTLVECMGISPNTAEMEVCVCVCMCVSLVWSNVWEFDTLMPYAPWLSVWEFLGILQK